MNTNTSFSIITWQEDSWFIAKTIEPEVASQGKTKDEAIENLKEALELYYEDKSLPTNTIKNVSLANINISNA